jgi:hypothetical protein
MNRSRIVPRLRRHRDVMVLLARSRPGRLDPDHDPGYAGRCPSSSVLIVSSQRPGLRSADQPEGNGRPARARSRLHGRSRPVGEAGAWSLPRRAPKLWAAVFSAVATGAAIAAVVVILPGAQAPAPGHRPGPGHRQSPGRGHPRPGRDQPLTGRYWHVQKVQGLITAGGTRRHPYDIASRALYQLWLSPKAGLRDWGLWQQLGAMPVTPEDQAQWLAAGAPTRWLVGGGLITTRPSAAMVTWTDGHGNVGYIERDLPRWTLSQFRALPVIPERLMDALRGIAMKLPSAPNPQTGGATVDQLIWDEAVQILQSPVSIQVRAAAVHVLAELPGVRSLGRMRDPFGRPGFGLGTGRSALGDIAVIDPATGWLLAIEEPGTPAGLTPGDQSRPACPPSPLCPSAAVYYHRVYRGQLVSYTVIMSLGWTSSGPQVGTPIGRNPILTGY